MASSSKYSILSAKEDYDVNINMKDDDVTLITESDEDYDDDENDCDDCGDVELIKSSSSTSTSMTVGTNAHKQQQDIDDEDNTKELIQLWRISSLAIPLCYLMVGLTQGTAYPLINVYPLDLGATEAQQQTLWFLKGLPSCLKIGFGFLTDNFPICGKRRKPYMLIGWSLSIFSLSVLILGSSDLSLSLSEIEDGDGVSSDSATTNTVRMPPENAPSIVLLSIVFFMWATGVWLADVIGDSLVAEKAKLETDGNRGNLQASCYILRGLGMAIMAPISSVVYNTPNGPYWIILSAAVLPLSLVPFIYLLEEQRVKMDEDRSTETKRRMEELWNTACSKAVYQPMGFVFIYISFFVSNAAWREFLKSVLGFTANELNALMFVAGLLAFVGIVVYKFVLIKWSWRTIFFLGIIVNGVFSFAQIVLITDNIPFGLSAFWFSLGDDGVRDFVLGTQYLPMCIMMVNLVPEGIEGMSYSLFTTTWNAASAVSDAVSTMLLSVWDVSKSTLIDDELNGLIKLTILTTAMQVFPLTFINFMPHSVHDLNRLKQEESQSQSKLGGCIYLSVVFCSVAFAIFVGVMNVVHPGWMGES